MRTSAAATGKQLVLYMSKDMSILAQCWRDTSFVVQEFDGASQEKSKHVFRDQRTQLRIGRVECGSEDEDVTELSSHVSEHS